MKTMTFQELRSESAAKAEAEKAERDAWIREHGSDRLKKALELGFADQSMGLYRNERLALEYEESWRWHWESNQDLKDAEHKEIRNPSIEALEAYEKLLADERIPDPELIYLQWYDSSTRYNVAAVYATVLGKLAYYFVGEVEQTSY